MPETASSRLSYRLSRLRWLALGSGLLLVIIHQVSEGAARRNAYPGWELSEVIIGVSASLLAWGVLTSLRHTAGEAETASYSLEQVHAELSKANEQLTCFSRVSRRLAEAQDEETLFDIILELPTEVVPAVATSLIRFDEHEQPLPAIHHGLLEQERLEMWAAHLTADDTHQRCACCTTYSAATTDDCPLFLTIFSSLAIRKVHCLSLARGAHKYGVLSIYLKDPRHPTPQEQSLLEVMAQEMGLALESHCLRARELDMLSQVQRIRQLSNLHDDLAGMLAHTVEAIEVNGGTLFLAESKSAELHLEAEVGQWVDTTPGLVRGLAEDSWQAGAPLIIRDVGQADTVKGRSLLATPLHTANQALGSLVLWAADPDTFTRHRVRLIATVARQAGLLVENHQLYLQGEYRAALAERARLSREIHDGLAQTLGYLKLRAAQIADWLQNGESQRTITGLAEMQKLLNEAYVDAREAIDGLSLAATDGNLHEWLDEMASGFEMLSGIPVETAVPPDVSLPLEVHAQLQRIAQEALSNIRKHAGATCARLEWQMDGDWLTLRISDDGVGFDPDDVPPIARHGLRMIRERAELLDADFQITSRPGQGAQITVRLPLEKSVEKSLNE